MLKPLSELGLEVKRVRTEAGMSQSELARKSGISRSTISSLESGTRKGIGWGKIVAIMKVLPGLPVLDGFHGFHHQLGVALTSLGIRLNDAGQLLFPIHVPGVKTRYKVLTQEILSKAVECLE